MASNSTSICTPCRFVSRCGITCPKCGGSLKNMGPKWRAPKKNNNKAWKRIERGDYLWDKRAIPPERFTPHHPKHDPKSRKSALFGLIIPFWKRG